MKSSTFEIKYQNHLFELFKFQSSRNNQHEKSSIKSIYFNFSYLKGTKDHRYETVFKIKCMFVS